MKRLLLTVFLAALPISSMAETSDATLNKHYSTMRTRLGDNTAGKDKLLAAQRTWISFRDNECRFRSSGVEGSAASMVYSACIDDLTEKRVKDFEALLNCPEGDLGCPIPRAE